MRLKVYQAPNMGAAMAMVRDELGPDALILANREVDGGVELTAAQEHPSAPVQAVPAPTGPASESGRERAAAPSQSVAEIARVGTLRWHGVPADLAAQLARGDLIDAITTIFRFDDLPCRRNAAPLLLVGPPGAGKTLTTARLATRLKRSGQASMIITTDGRRAGAAEQLAAFTRLLNLTLIVADTPQQLTRAIARRIDGDPVLVDMPGLDPSDPDDQRFVLDCQAALGAEIALVLPAGLDPAEAEEIATGFYDLGARYLVATRLDQSRRLGGVLAAGASGLAFTDAGINSAVADGLISMSPDFLVQRLAVARASNAAPVASSSTTPLALLARARGEQPRQSP